jgi:hypothetical protein
VDSGPDGTSSRAKYRSGAEAAAGGLGACGSNSAWSCGPKTCTSGSSSRGCGQDPAGVAPLISSHPTPLLEAGRPPLKSAGTRSGAKVECSSAAPLASAGRRAWTCRQEPANSGAAGAGG